MDAATFTGKLAERGRAALAWRVHLRHAAFLVERAGRRPFDAPYVERPEAGPGNLADKHARVAAGGPFEPYDVTLVNRAAVQLLGGARRVLELGCGTGCFASLAARDPSRHIVASELDAETLAWARTHRAAPNIEYCARKLADFPPDAFDVVVALELIEHVADFGGLLSSLTAAAPVAIVSTPNKNAEALRSVARTPEFSGHVREWTAGELYWVLRAFYPKVELFTIDDFPRALALAARGREVEPSLRPCGPLSTELPLLARCSRAA